ncbi:tryptophan 2-C-methyltransferase [Micromonospora sp. WMMD956]|uniref:tryptophan 2-C-methyltransferase n=1 Tax=Micromonospora TaxID=1873 RepID=UPI002417DC07|nr:tryptophan 2-C-methyltransferase [Micromonospora sp. WMMD956]MDG4816758.1 tryptophan 2-C-methyltransferase [Micromonospora sp. WMMD956]
MTRGLVTLVNPNKVHPPIAPYALDVLTTALEHSGYTVEVVDLTFRRDDWQVVVAEYFSVRQPLLVGVTVRNTDTTYALEQRPFVDEHREIIRAVRQRTNAPLVAGGIGFSTMPFALVDYFGVDFGVKGPGEVIICDLADALAEGRDPRSVGGLLVNEGGGRVVSVPARPPVAGAGPLARAGHNESRLWQVNRRDSYHRRSGDPLKVDNLAYYRQSGIGSILTKNGCVYRCSHCVEPDAKGTQFARRGIPAVVDEIESLVAQGVHDLHTTDSEFNLAIGHSKALLREIVRRRNTDHSGPLHDLRLWIYCQPAPFDEEFAELLAAAGCAGVNVGADHVRRDLLDGWKVTAGGSQFYAFEDTVRLVELSHRYGMRTMVEALFGMPGETRETMRRCVDEFMALDAHVTGFSLGLRLFPYTALGIRMAEQCAGVRTVPGLQSNNAREPIVLKPLAMCSGPVEYERQFMFDDDGGFRLVCYFSPDLPEDPARVSDPAGRWRQSVQFLWDQIPAREHYRVMLPTVAGMSEHDNNYADNPFLLSLCRLGYSGAFWSHWRERRSILQEAHDRGVLEAATG